MLYSLTSKHLFSAEWSSIAIGRDVEMINLLDDVRIILIETLSMFTVRRFKNITAAHQDHNLSYRMKHCLFQKFLGSVISRSNPKIRRFLIHINNNNKQMRTKKNLARFGT